MARTRFVQGETVRLPLSGGDYIDVKKELSAGEREDLYGVIAPTMTAGDDKVLMNTRSVRIARVLAYLLSWSLVGRDGTPIPMSPDLPAEARLGAIRSLRVGDFDEIYAAVVTHEVKEAETASAEKNDPGGAIDSAKTSPSVS